MLLSLVTSRGSGCNLKFDVCSSQSSFPFKIWQFSGNTLHFRLVGVLWKSSSKGAVSRANKKFRLAPFLQHNSSPVLTKIFAMKLLFRLAEHFVEKSLFLFCHSGQKASDTWHILLTFCNIVCLLVPVRNFQDGREEEISVFIGCCQGLNHSVWVWPNAV